MNVNININLCEPNLHTQSGYSQNFHDSSESYADLDNSIQFYLDLSRSRGPDFFKSFLYYVYNYPEQLLITSYKRVFLDYAFMNEPTIDFHKPAMPHYDIIVGDYINSFEKNYRRYYHKSSGNQSLIPKDKRTIHCTCGKLVLEMRINSHIRSMTHHNRIRDISRIIAIRNHVHINHPY